MFYFLDPQHLRPNSLLNSNKDNQFCSTECVAGAVDGRLQCKCGELSPVFDWTWEDQQAVNVRVSRGGREVLFHPVFSSGTAVVKGVSPFRQNNHYYWEIKVLSRLYGTDVMIGVGTSNVIPQDSQYKFCSLLGSNEDSWGFSYHGYLQHCKLRKKYGVPFGLGSIVGVYLDMYKGTMEFFLNRKPLGIAFTNLKDKDLFPMVCSTAAQSSIRITCCVTEKDSLQMMCLKRIMARPTVHQQYKNIPGLSKLYDKQYFWIQPDPDRIDEKEKMEELDNDVTMSLVDGSYLMKNKRPRSFSLISSLYEDDLAPDLISGRESTDIYNFELPLHQTEIDDSTTLENSVPRMSTKIARCNISLSENHESKDCLSANDIETDTAELIQIL